MLKVMAGDTIQISAKAFYNIDNDFPGNSVDVASIIGALLAGMTGMTNPTGTATGGEIGSSSQASPFSSTSPSSSSSPTLGNLPEEKDEKNSIQPQSGINFVLYNSRFDVVEENTGYLPVDDKINAIQILATDMMVMTEAGFIEIFVNNDAQTPVYYDNMTVTMRGGNAMEVNAYYPYGMIIPDLSTTAMLPGEYNAYKYNAKELQKELELNWLDYGARMMDPVVGRWLLPDPLAEKYYHISPYAYCANNPLRYIDPDGMDWYSYEEETEPDIHDDNKLKKVRKYKWVDGQMTKEEMGKKYKHLGKIYKTKDTYFSLLGEQFNLKNDDGKNNYIAEAVINLDQAIINNYNYTKQLKEFDDQYRPANPGNPPEQKPRDMTVSREVRRSGNNTFIFPYGGGDVWYSVATDMTGGIFRWGNNEMREVYSKTPTVNAIVMGGQKWQTITIWKFPSVESRKSVEQRVGRLLKN